MSKRRRIGAPPGLTVHWLPDELTGEFTVNYRLSFNRRFHNYHYARYRKRTLIDEFIIIRTSRRCFRGMYFNADYNHFMYFSAPNYLTCANKMREIYQIFKRLEEAQKRRDPPNDVEKSRGEE